MQELYKENVIDLILFISTIRPPLYRYPHRLFRWIKSLSKQRDRPFIQPIAAASR